MSPWVLIIFLLYINGGAIVIDVPDEESCRRVAQELRQKRKDLISDAYVCVRRTPPQDTQEGQ